jgi:uncharacterized membrane protein YebE (DUF533 family)
MRIPRAFRSAVVALAFAALGPITDARAQTVPEATGSWAEVAGNPWVVQGAVLGMVTVNALTGGAMLAPLVGQTASTYMGGSWQTTTLLAWMAAGAGAGYWATQQWPELLEE